MGSQVRSFSIVLPRDDDIDKWLGGLDNVSAEIREAIRQYRDRKENGSGVTLGDIYDAVVELKQAGIVVSELRGDGAADENEPPDIAAALDSLGS